MAFHLEAIEAVQHDLLRRLGPVVTARGFYLAGGTALALYFGHRRSVDFDWFTGEPLDDPLRLAQALRDASIEFTTGQVEPGTLYGTVHDVLVSFFAYRYPQLGAPVDWPAYGIKLAALDDLAAMKLSAIAQRGAKKDFIDLHALLRRHRPLPDLLDTYRRKYRTDDIAHLLYALVYFDDAEREPTPTMLWDLDWATVKLDIRDQVRQIAE